MVLRGVLFLATWAVMGYGRVDMAKAVDPAADADAVLTVGHARFTVLTPALIRMEWAPDAAFEDRASLVFTNRRLPVPKFTVDRAADGLTLTTEALTLRYRDDGRPFSADNLSIERREPKPAFAWKPGLESKGNLKGTYRTLDTVSGGVPLPDGLLSRDGWALVDDSRGLLFDHVAGTDWPWATPRRAKDALDWYFFGYGHDYPQALADFTQVAGRIPLPPRFAFGAWWSRYWAYTDAELRELVGEFREHDVPLDVLVIDMDWHLDGWTGYTWNPKYFPDPDGFLKWVRAQGLRATLNLHPASGVKKHEQAFPDVARAMGLDPETAEEVPFDCADPRYVDAYFKYLHHPLERQGIDFWWIDWQQGEETKIAGLDPLWWLNYLHWTDMERNPERHGQRPMMFSRWGGLGNHRYQIGFSGDTYCNWPSLAFQPFFTSTAGNVGYPYWSHDIGGHMPGPVDPELYVRWIQWGVFSPILRTHTTKNPLAERRIWKFPEPVFQAARDAFQLRYALQPYIYTAARQCYDTALPLCRPLYYEWPELDEAYRYTGEYLFGNDLLLAPVTKPATAVSACAETRVWLPPGEWTHWFTGRTYAGPGLAALQVPLDEIPIFVRRGAIIPLQPKMSRTGAKPVDPLILHLWPGDSGAARVYEDDNETSGYQKNECAWTPVTQALADGGGCRVTIGPVEGTFAGMVKERAYEVCVRDVWPAQNVTVNGQPLPKADPGAATGWWYDETTLDVVIRTPRRNVGERTEINIAPTSATVDAALWRGGLRGWLNRLEQVAAALPAAGRAVSPSAADVRHSVAEGKAGPADTAAGLQRAAQALLAAILVRSDLDPAVQRQALVRLLGLQCDFEVVGAPDGAPQLRLTGAVSVSPPPGLLAKAAGRLELSPPPNWSIRGPSNWSFADLAEGKIHAVEATLVPDGAPQTTVLQHQFVLEAGETRLEIPGRKVLLPSINTWWVIGPFDAGGETGLAEVFPPEEKIDLAATYTGTAEESIRWRKVVRPIDASTDLAAEFFVRLTPVFGKYHQQAVAYALTYLHAPADLEAVLAFGSDDGDALWLNGVEIHRKAVGRPYQSKEERVPVQLKKGSNPLLLKVNQLGGDWGFCVHVETPTGEPLTAVTARLEP